MKAPASDRDAVLAPSSDGDSAGIYSVSARPRGGREALSSGFDRGDHRGEHPRIHLLDTIFVFHEKQPHPDDGARLEKQLSADVLR
jgi:hypothetical protein